MIAFSKFINKNSNNMTEVLTSSVDLVVTSPPYPMIEMWDQIFGKMNNAIFAKLDDLNGYEAFELMHKELDKVWLELNRVVKPGGIVCINIGDATRTLGEDFQIYFNSSRIILKMQSLGFHTLPSILWRKPTNSPTKFMGSGMLPAGAYVTLEHEHILIFRKGSKRKFISEESKLARRESAFFWEERNVWFSDLWDFTGTRQIKTDKLGRDRTAAYPIELTNRLISMFSIYGDLVLDPFSGTGTTMFSAASLGRNSIGYDIDNSFIELSLRRFDQLKSYNYNFLIERLFKHNTFIEQRENNNHFNTNLGEFVVTNQEKNIKLFFVVNVLMVKSKKFESEIQIEYDINTPALF